jgi:hypothetical protein
MIVPHRKHLWASTVCYTGNFTFFLICRWCWYLIGNTYGPPRSVTWIALLFLCRWSYLTGNTPMGLHGLLRGSLYFFLCRWWSYLTGNTPVGLHGHLGDSFTFLKFSLSFELHQAEGKLSGPRSEWPRVIWHEMYLPAQTLEPLVRVPLEACISAPRFSVPLLCVGSDLPTGLLTVCKVLSSRLVLIGTGQGTQSIKVEEGIELPSAFI